MAEYISHWGMGLRCVPRMGILRDFQHCIGQTRLVRKDVFDSAAVIPTF